MDGISYGVMAALVGLVSGVVLGLSARLGNFCTLGALEMAVYGGDQRRLRLSHPSHRSRRRGSHRV